MDIEKLTKETYQNAEATPPADAWNTISEQLASQPAAPKNKRPWWAFALLACALAAGTIWILRPSDEQSIEMASNNIESTPSTEIPTPKSDEVTSPIETSQEEPLQKEITTKDNLPQEKTISNPKTEAPTTQVPSKSETITAAPTTEAPTNEAKPSTTIASPAQTAKNPEKPQPKPQSTTKPTTQRTAAPTQDTRTASTQSQTVTTPQPPAQETEKINFNVPNLITPNSDGINDCWVIDSAKDYTDFHVQIFTAKSKKIYENAHYDNQFCGDDLPDGQYFYVISIRSVNYTRRGVLIIRR